MGARAGRVLTVNVVAEIRPNPGEHPNRTAIDKRPVDGAVAVGPLGVLGDRQMDTKHHGGRDQAVYAFAREDVVHWESELGHAIAPGTFGENLTLEGVEVSDALVGERWQVGDGPDAVVLEAVAPRVPCMTFEKWMAEPRWIKRFAAHGRVGTYLRVVTPGAVSAGDPVEVVFRPSHGITVGDAFRALTLEAAGALHAADQSGEIELAGTLRRKVVRRLR